MRRASGGPVRGNRTRKGPVGERAGEPADTGAEAEGGRAGGKVSGAGTACAGIMR